MRSRPFFAAGVGVLLLSLGAASVVAQERKPTPGAYEWMDYGPVMGETITAEWPEGNVALKGLAVRLEGNSAMVFDTDLLRWSAATVDGWIDLSRTSRTSYKGSRPARTEGRQVFGTEKLAGWGRDGRFDGEEIGSGPLPKDWGHWRGYYVHGERAVLEYTVGETEVWEVPSAVEVDGSAVFVRDIFTSGSAEAMSVRVADVPEAGSVEALKDGILVAGGEMDYFFGVESRVKGVRFREAADGRVELEIPAHRGRARIRLIMAELPAGSEDSVGAVRREVRKLKVDLEEMLAGGPRVWEGAVETEAVLGEEDAAYVVDSIPLPFENPWNSWMRPTGFDFFADGDRLAMATWNGDVWIASGLGKMDLGKVRWERFATGLYYPLGLRIVDETIYVAERSQLTRLRDLNGDGEADFYENFNNDGLLHPMAHSIELDVDSKGNFYFYKNGNRVPEGVPEHGALVRVSADGKRREIVADGIRGSNALGIGPDDKILGADQQGNWVPTARVDWIRDGGFYGYRPHGGAGIPEGEYDLPVMWVPHKVDNSSGSLVFVKDERWGPMAGKWAMVSYGQGSLMTLFTEMKGEVMQGGVVRYPLSFSSGAMRARVSPGDGQLYVMGMKGWGTLVPDDGSFDRVRYTGKPSYLPVDFGVGPDGVRVTFSEKLDPATVRPENFEVQRWEYIYSSSYGSPEVSIANPGEQGRDDVAVASVRLEEDGKTVFVEIPDIAPAMQAMVAYKLGFADGGSAENAVYHTIHRLTDEDVPAARAIVEKETLKSAEQPAVLEEEVEEQPDASWAAFADGRELYEMNCSSCHQTAGRFGIAPDLGKSDWVAGSPDALVRILLHGKEGESGVMMPFGQMSDEDLALMLSYLRTRYHGEEPVSAEKVAEVRAAEADRKTIWKKAELEEVSRAAGN